MRFAQVGAPVPAADGDDGELGDDDGGADGRRDFLGGLDAEADVAGGVADDDYGFEARALAGAGLFLDGFDLRGWLLGLFGCVSARFGWLGWRSPQTLPPLPKKKGEGEGENEIGCRSTYLHDLVLELGQEEIHNLELLDGERVQVYLLHALDLAGLDQAAQLGHGLPLLLLGLVAAAVGRGRECQPRFVFSFCLLLRTIFRDGWNGIVLC